MIRKIVFTTLLLSLFLSLEAFGQSVGLSTGVDFYMPNVNNTVVSYYNAMDLEFFRIGGLSLNSRVTSAVYYENEDNDTVMKHFEYRLLYGYLKYQFESANLLLFSDHICLNVINDKFDIRISPRWYGVGLRLETSGMQPGFEDKGIIFDWTGEGLYTSLVNGYFQGAHRVNPYGSEFYSYIWQFKAGGRVEFPPLGSFIPFAGIDGVLLINDDSKLDSTITGGARFPLVNGSLTLVYENHVKHDADTYGGLTDRFYTFGMRYSTRVGSSQEGGTLQGLEDNAHFEFSYGAYDNDTYLFTNAEFFLTLRIFSTPMFTLLFNQKMYHDSTLIDNGMMFSFSPKNLFTQWDGLFLFDTGFWGADLGVGYTSWSRNISNDNFPDKLARYNALIFQVSTENFYNFNKSRDIAYLDEGFRLFDRIEAKGGIEWLLMKQNIPYDYRLFGVLKAHLVGYSIFTLYSNFINDWFSDTGHEMIWELGLKISTGIDYSFIYRYTKRNFHDTKLFRDYENRFWGVKFVY